MAPEQSDATSGTASGPPTAPMQRPSARQLAPSLVINFLLPVVGYFLLRPHVSSDTLALGLVLAIPVVRTLFVLIVRRRVDPIGVVAAVVLGLSVAVSLFSGGGSLPLKSSEAIFSGVLGLACLVSVAIGRPLHLLVVKGRIKEPLPPTAVHTSRVVTLIMGGAFLLHSAVHMVFALTLSTGSFLIVSRLVGYAVIAVGLSVVYWYMRVKKRRIGVGGVTAGETEAHRG